jgi:hypothetical protein
VGKGSGGGDAWGAWVVGPHARARAGPRRRPGRAEPGPLLF